MDFRRFMTEADKIERSEDVTHWQPQGKIHSYGRLPELTNYYFRTASFTVRQIEQQCPGVSRELIRKIMKQHDTCLECTGKGPAAVWKRVRVLPLSEGKSKGTGE